MRMGPPRVPRETDVPVNKNCLWTPRAEAPRAGHRRDREPIAKRGLKIAPLSDARWHRSPGNATKESLFVQRDADRSAFDEECSIRALSGGMNATLSRKRREKPVRLIHRRPLSRNSTVF